MEVGTLFLILHDATEVLVGDGVILPDGKMIAPHDVSAYALLASQIEEKIKARGIQIPVKVDKIIKILPLVLEIAGV